jgi:putative transposase
MIQQEQATGDLSVEALCESLEVSPSGYYAWRGRDLSPHQQAEMCLGDEVERVFIKSRRTCGKPSGLVGPAWARHLHLTQAG